jgi:hypothetical protein
MLQRNAVPLLTVSSPKMGLGEFYSRYSPRIPFRKCFFTLGTGAAHATPEWVDFCLFEAPE